MVSKLLSGSVLFGIYTADTGTTALPWSLPRPQALSPLRVTSSLARATMMTALPGTTWTNERT